jgi:MFS family permease
MPFIALGVSMIIVDATIVNVAIPSIIRDIGISVTDAEWVNSIYSLVFASLLLTTGRLGDIYGRRRLFLLGTVVFVVASLVAALAPSAGVLILGRFLQGIGGAMLLPASLSTVNALYQGKDRAIAFAIWGSTIGGTAALGPLLGGWLTTAFSWRWALSLIHISEPTRPY